MNSIKEQIVDITSQLETNNTKSHWKKRARTSNIAIHHSETHGQNVFDLSDWHVSHNDWYRISYHYVITKTGVIYKCNDEMDYTYHVGRSNRDTIGICVVGDYDVETPEDHKFMMISLLELVVDLAMKYDVSSLRVLGHREIEGFIGKKTCPGMKFDMNMLRSSVARELVHQLDIKIHRLENRLHTMRENKDGCPR